MSPLSYRAGTVVIALSLLGAACSGGGGDGKEKTAKGTVRPACVPVGDERPAKAVLRCTEGSVAYVKVEQSSGTGVVVEAAGKRYVLTNEHVVDPFDAADATIAGRKFTDLPVVGIDASSDIALLGPLTGAKLPAPLAIADGTDLERGDDLFLVGFPGEIDPGDDLEATIASGIVSRVRKVAEFDKAFIQTDASIGGGQSGGPLFDGNAEVVGISGLSFAEEFALALTGRDVKEAMARILKGKGDEYLSVSSRVGGRQAGTTSGTIELYDGEEGQALYLPAADEARTWNLTVDMALEPIVSVANLDEEVLAVSGNATKVQEDILKDLAKARGGRPENIADLGARGIEPKLAARESKPGVFVIPVKADESAMVFFMAPKIDRPSKVTWKSDQPLHPLSRPVEEAKLVMGESIDKILGGLDTSVDVFVDLAAGQKVLLHARSPQGDPVLAVFKPGQKLDHLTAADLEGAGIEIFDDTEDGLFGADAKTVYEAEEAGTYRFRVMHADYYTNMVRFSVQDCAAVDCDDKDAPAAKTKAP
jgi:hypothetical protein